MLPSLVLLAAAAAADPPDLRLNHLQVVGTHNSYHLAPGGDLAGFFAGDVEEWQYSHLPLTRQLAEQGVRQFELDVWADPEGGRFATPVGRGFAAPLEEMDAPGFKVLHVPDVDYRSTVPTLAAALAEVRAWSEANPTHVPILLLIEVKSGGRKDPLGLGFVQVPRPTAAELDALDAELRAGLGPLLLTPDDVRGEAETLAEVTLAGGWPTLASARGRVLCALDNTGAEKGLYLEGHPSLRGRAMFADSRPGDAHAGFAKRNDPLRSGEEIRDLVARGFLVRTRADSGGAEARADDPRRREAALGSGAQFVSTDYPVADPATGTTYAVRLPGGVVARCNPVSAPAGCAEASLAGPEAGTER